MPAAARFTPDSITVILSAITIALLVLVILPLLFLICRLRDVGCVRRIHPLLLAQHAVVGVACTCFLLARVMVLATSTSEPILFTTSSCEVFVASARALLATRRWKETSGKLWTCVSDAYGTPFQLVTTAASKLELANARWWRRVPSVWLPIGVVVAQSALLVVLLATLINVLTALWQDGVRNVEVAIRRGHLRQYLQTTRRRFFFSGAWQSGGEASSSGAASDGLSQQQQQQQRRGDVFTVPDVVRRSTDSSGAVSSASTNSERRSPLRYPLPPHSSSHTTGASSSESLQGDLFDNSVRVRGPISAKRALSQQIEGPLMAPHTAAGQTANDGSNTKDKNINNNNTNNSLLRRSFSTLWRSLRLPTFGRHSRTDNKTATGEPTWSHARAQDTESTLSSHARSLSSSSSSSSRGASSDAYERLMLLREGGGAPVRTAVPRRHVSFGRSPLDDGSGPFGAQSGLSGSGPNGSGFSFGSVSEGSGSLTTGAETVTVRPRLNVQNLALQQRLLQAREKQQERQKHDRRIRRERELLSSFWISHRIAFAVVAIPFLILCACRVVLLLLSVQLSQSLPGSAVVMQTPPVTSEEMLVSFVLSATTITASSSSSMGVVVYMAPIDGYLGLACALVLLCDHIAAARFKRAIQRLHHNSDARAAIPRARPPVALAGAIVGVLLVGQVVPQEVRLWASAALWSAVSLSLTMIFFAYDPVWATIRDYDKNKTQAHSRIALLFAPWIHPVDANALQTRAEAAKVVESAQERRRSRRVVLATEAATAAVSAVTDASNGNPMAAQDAATVAAHAAQQLLREELEDEATGGVAEMNARLLDSEAMEMSETGGGGGGRISTTSSPLGGSFTKRGRDEALTDALAFVARGSGITGGGGGAEELMRFAVPTGAQPPQGILSASGLSGSTHSTARAANNFWEGIASRVHEQYNDVDELTGSDGVVVSPNPALLDGVEVDGHDAQSNSGRTVGDWSSVSASTVATNSGGAGEAGGLAAPPLSSVVASAAVVSALMASATGEGIDDISESSTTTTTTTSDASGGLGNGASRVSHASALRGGGLAGQLHTHIRRAVAVSPSDALSATTLGDLHGSILLKAPGVVGGGGGVSSPVSSSDPPQPQQQQEQQQQQQQVCALSSASPVDDTHDDPLHVQNQSLFVNAADRDGMTTNTTATTLTTPSTATLSSSSASSSIPTVLKKSFAFLANPGDWFHRGNTDDGNSNNSNSDAPGVVSSASSGLGDGSTARPGHTSNTSSLSFALLHSDVGRAIHAQPMLILDPPSDSDEAPAHATRHDVVSNLSLSASQAAAAASLSTMNSTTLSALREEGRSAAMVATAAKAARALRAVAVSNADEGFPVFLSAVRQSGNNITLLRELMSSTGTRYVHMCDDDGRTALHHATLGNHVHGIVFLLEMGADPNARDGKGFTPLHLAVSAQSRHPVQPDIDDDPSHTSPQEGRRHASRRRRQLSAVPSPSLPVPVLGASMSALLPPAQLATRPATTATTEDPKTGTVAGFPATGALLQIKQLRRPHRTWRGVINALVRGGADVNATTDDGRTPLHMAIADELVGALQTLLREGADPLAAWESEDSDEVKQPGSGRWVHTHVTNMGVVAAGVFHKAPLLYALEVGSTMSVTTILSFIQLQEEILRVEGSPAEPRRSTTKGGSAVALEDVPSLTSLLKKKWAASGTARAPASPSPLGSPLSNNHCHSDDSVAAAAAAPPWGGAPDDTPPHIQAATTAPPKQATICGAIVSPEAHAAEAVKASALVRPSQRRRRVIAKTTARAVASTAEVVAAAVATAEAERKRRRLAQQRRAGGDESNVTSWDGCPRTVASPTNAAALHAGAGASSVISHLDDSKDKARSSLSSEHGDSASVGSTALNDFAAAWGQQFMPQCLHGLTLLDIALVLGHTKVVETLLRHHMLWYRQMRSRRDEVASSSRHAKSLLSGISSQRASAWWAVSQAGDVAKGQNAQKEDADEIEDVDVFSDTRSGEDAVGEGGEGGRAVSQVSSSTASSQPRGRRRSRRTGASRVKRQITEREYNEYAQSMLLPTLAGSGVNVVRGVVEAAMAYVEGEIPTQAAPRATSAGAKTPTTTTSSTTTTEVAAAAVNPVFAVLDGLVPSLSGTVAHNCAAPPPSLGLTKSNANEGDATSPHPSLATTTTTADALEPVEAAATTTSSNILNHLSIAATTVETLQDAPAATTVAMVNAHVSQRRQTLFHYAALGDSTEATAYVLDAVGMPDFVPDGNPFTGFDTAWCVQQPHRTRDTRTAMARRNGGGASYTSAFSLGSTMIEGSLAATGLFSSPARVTKATSGVFDASRLGKPTATTHAPPFSRAATKDEDSGPLSGVSSPRPPLQQQQQRRRGSSDRIATAAADGSHATPAAGSWSPPGGGSESASNFSERDSTSSGGGGGTGTDGADNGRRAFLVRVVAVAMRQRHALEKEANRTESEFSTSNTTLITGSPTWDLGASSASQMGSPTTATAGRGRGSLGLTGSSSRAGLDDARRSRHVLRSSDFAFGSASKRHLQKQKGSQKTATTTAGSAVAHSATSSVVPGQSPWKNARRRIEERRGHLLRLPVLCGASPNLLRAIPMNFNTAVVKLRQRVPTIPIDLPHLSALEAAVDYACHSALDMAGGGKEIRRLQRALLVVSLHLQQELLAQRTARRRHTAWRPPVAGSHAWKLTTNPTVRPRNAKTGTATDPRGWIASPTSTVTSTAFTMSPPPQAHTDMLNVSPSPAASKGVCSPLAASPVFSTHASQEDKAKAFTGDTTANDSPAADPAQAAAEVQQQQFTRAPTASALLLMESQRRARIAVARVMLALNSLDEFGLTPLHYVIANHNANLVFVLCCHGAIFTFASAETKFALSGSASQLNASTSSTLTITTATAATLPVGNAHAPATTAVNVGGTSGGQPQLCVADAQSHSSSHTVGSAVLHVHDPAEMASSTTGSTGSPAQHTPAQSTTHSLHGDRTAVESTPTGRSQHTDSAPCSPWVDASAIPPAINLATTPTAEHDDAEGHQKNGDDHEGEAVKTHPHPALMAPLMPLAVTNLPSTPQMDSFLASSPATAEVGGGARRRVSTPMMASASGNSAPTPVLPATESSSTMDAAADAFLAAVVASSPAALENISPSTLAKPPLAPGAVAPVSASLAVNSGVNQQQQQPSSWSVPQSTAEGSEGGGSLLEIFSPLPQNSTIGTNVSSERGSHSDQLHNGGHSQTLSALEGSDAVGQASLILYKYDEAYISQLPAEIGKALEVAADTQSARHLLEALEAAASGSQPSHVEVSATPGASGAGDCKNSNNMNSTSSSSREKSETKIHEDSALSATSLPSAPFLPMPGSMLEPHDVFVLHVVRDAAKAASIIQAGLEGMAVWKQKMSRSSTLLE